MSLPESIRFLAASLFAALLPAQGYAVILYAGLDGGANVPFHAATVPPTGLTVEAWVRFDDATMPTGVPYFPTIVSQNADTQASWLLRVASGSTNNRIVEFLVRDGAGVLQSLTWPFAAGELSNWTHLAATYDGQVMTLFKNSVQVATLTLGAAYEVQNLGGVLRIGNGNRTIPGRETWNGYIDELRIWPMPRSAAEIAATQNSTLLSMPGKVLTYNLDGDFYESSIGLSGTGFGTFNTFVDGPLLTGGGYSASSDYGPSTTTCPRPADIGIGSLANLGNSAFNIWCTKAPTHSPIGLFVIAAQQAPVQPPFLGVSLAFTPQSVITIAAYAPATFGLGLQRQPLPIPNSMALLQFTVFGQFVFFDAQCGPQGLSASNGLTIAVQSN
ncbi:MAG TPA: LamG domain-containing protein [Planctomycetota bacterium]|nr:LamG domain-containing protein [Planctomycetota bacterium]